jgi:SAM-dependent methyltransferase
LEEYGCQRILEVGSGANPTLEAEYVRAKSFDYVTSDICEEELEKADPVYARLLLDLSSEVDPRLQGSFDCVFSRMVAEHVRNGSQYHKNIFDILRPGGIAVHCMSCQGSLPFLMNRVLPDRLSEVLLSFFSPRDGARHGKFRAYYSWASGPSQSMINRFRSLGFEVVQFIGSFGHHYYRNRIPVLNRLEMFKSVQLMKHPIPQFCSYATVILRKPETRA